MIQVVHQELCELSRDLKLRNEKLQKDSDQLEMLRREVHEGQSQLDQREKQIKKEVHTMIHATIRQKEKQMKQDTQEVIKKYEEVIDQLNKENKRLQTSLKDMVNTNRTLRDQNKRVLQEMDEKDKRIEEYSLQIRQLKDRLDRVKPTVAIQPTVDLDKDVFAQMKKMLNNHPKPTSTVTISVQTDIERESIPATTKTDTAVPPELIRLIHFLLSKLQQSDAEPFFFNAIVTSFESMEQACTIHVTTSPIQKQILQHTNQLLLETIYSNLASLEPIEVCKIDVATYHCQFGVRITGQTSSTEDT
jgi:phage host-nuclease inhibitor protein Gam